MQLRAAQTRKEPTMGNNGRMRDDNQDWRSQHDRDREFEDRDEGNRRGDHPVQMQRDRYATGQSGYSAGRSGDERSLDYQNRNQGYSRGSRQDSQAFGTDDRFTGRGGSDYSYNPERYGAQGGYGAGRGNEDRSGRRDSFGDRNYDQGFGRTVYDHRDDNRSFRSQDYGPSESERGSWSTQTQRRDGTSQTGDMGRSGQMGQTGEGPHRGKGPRGYTRSDERIKETVCEALTEHSHIDASGIDVEVKNGEVILSGMVADRRTKRMAEDLVEDLGGVRDITNQLKVSDDERQRLGRSQQSGNQNGNGVVNHDEPRKGGDDKKARA
jgi:hypothetical protein